MNHSFSIFKSFLLFFSPFKFSPTLKQVWIKDLRCDSWASTCHGNNLPCLRNVSVVFLFLRVEYNLLLPLLWQWFYLNLSIFEGYQVFLEVDMVFSQSIDLVHEICNYTNVASLFRDNKGWCSPYTVKWVVPDCVFFKSFTFFLC